MISYSVPAEVRPQHCLLCLLSGPGAKALPKRVKDGAATRRCIRCRRENTMWLHSSVSSLDFDAHFFGTIEIVRRLLMMVELVADMVFRLQSTDLSHYCYTPF